MKKSIILSLSVVVMIVLFAGIAVSRYVTPDSIKSEMSEKFYELTGRSLVIHGDVHWSFFPWLGIKVQNVVINNTNDFPQIPLAKADKVDVAIKLMPLLAKHIEIGDISIDGLDLHLIKKANGQKNWDHLSADSSSQTDSSTEEKSNLKAHTFQIHSINIKQSRLFFDDQKEHKTIDLNHVNVATKNISLNRPFDLKLSLAFTKQPDSVSGDVGFDGTLAVFSEKNTFDFSHVTFSAQGRVQSHTLPVGSFLFKNLQAMMNVNHETLSLHSLTANLYGGNYTGNILVDMKSVPHVVTLNGALTKADVSVLFTEFMHKKNSPFTGTANLTTRLKFTTGSADAMLKTLNGNVSVLLENGVLHGINIPSLIDLAQAVFKRQAFSKDINNQTDFGKLSATFQIQNGVMSNQNLMLQSTQLEATGQGDIDLVKQHINYRLNAGLVGHKVMIPIVIRGNLDGPVIAPDVQKVLKNTTVDGLLTAVTGGDADKKNKLKEKLGGELKKLHIESLFG